MNFLAHIYLSFGNSPITIGNFIADSLSSKQYKQLPLDLQKGVQLHRAIDTFTDAHPIARQSSKRLHPNYGHYSMVIVDLFYDHFLAKNWLDYSDEPLVTYVDNFYGLLEDHYTVLPQRVKHMMPYMIKDNWIANYANIPGMTRVLEGMNRRTNNKSKMNFAILDLEKHYDAFEREFTDFFAEMIPFAKQKYITLCEDSL